MSRNADEYIRTYTGRKFYALDPHPEDVDIRDIAHALSNNCRWGGHAHTFYSVAQHSLFVAYFVPTLEALLHDASEAYIMDMPRPIKRQMPEYSAIEDRLMRCIAERFGFAYPVDKLVKAADDFALYHEKRMLFPNSEPTEVLSDAAVDFFFDKRLDGNFFSPERIEFVQPQEVERLFIGEFAVLYGRNCDERKHSSKAAPVAA